MLAPSDIQALSLTLQLALVSTLVLIVLGTPLAWWLSQTESRVRPLVDALVALPLVLPPTVLGFYLLLVAGVDGVPGLAGWAFTFKGLVLGSVIYSLPFVVQPLRDAFQSIGKRPLEVAATLGAGPMDRFFSIAVPQAGKGFLTAAALGFAHTLGEFGVVLMIGGNIPGETRVASIAIYEHVETMNYAGAHALSITLVVVSLVLLTAVYALRRRRGGVMPV